MLSTRVMDTSLKYACLEHNEALNITEKNEVLAMKALNFDVYGMRACCQRREFGLESVDIARIDALYVLVRKKPERPLFCMIWTLVFLTVFVRPVRSVG